MDSPLDVKLECGTWALSHSIRGHLWRASAESEGRIYTASSDDPWVALGMLIDRLARKIHPMGHRLSVDRVPSSRRQRKARVTLGGDVPAERKPSRQTELDIDHGTPESPRGGDSSAAIHSGRDSSDE